MRFRLGMMTGFAAGYVLGAKAGTQRYEQIRQMWDKLAGSEPAQHLSAEVRDVASQAAHVAEVKATEGVERVADKVGGGGASSGTHGNGGGATSYPTT